MSKMFVAAVLLAVSVPVLVGLAGAELTLLHALVAALAVLSVVALAYADQSATPVLAVPQAAARDALYMALIWFWGAGVVVVTYLTVLSWPEWWQFALAFAAAGGLALFSYTRLLTGDPGVLRQSVWLGRVQMFGMLLVMFGLFIDGKMDRIGLTLQGPRDWSNDWAGNNAFFFGALALSLLSYLSLRSLSRETATSQEA
ncbi:MAG: hypothetical protein AAGF32_01060 [Pseudomonadota bacterium]